MAKLCARHDKLAAYRAGHRLHAGEYRSGNAANNVNLPDDLQDLLPTYLVLVLQGVLYELRVIPGQQLAHRHEPVSRGVRCICGKGRA